MRNRNLERRDFYISSSEFFGRMTRGFILTGLASFLVGGLTSLAADHYDTKDQKERLKKIKERNNKR